MKKSILTLGLAILGLGTVTTSCEDMLTPDLDRYATEFNGKDTVNFYLGILSGLQGMVEQNILLGELRQTPFLQSLTSRTSKTEKTSSSTALLTIRSSTSATTTSQRSTPWP